MDQPSEPPQPPAPAPTPNPDPDPDPEYNAICNAQLPTDAISSPLKVPKEEDNDAMRIWRATVSPFDNVGEPLTAEWGGFAREDQLPLDYPLSEYNNPPRWMQLKYAATPGHEDLLTNAWWIPGKKYEYGWIQINNGRDADEIPSFRVAHGPIPQYVPRAPHDPIPFADLSVDLIRYLATEHAPKGKQHLIRFFNRYVKTIHPFDDKYTREADTGVRRKVIHILSKSVNEEPGEAEIFLMQEWERQSKDFDKIALDADSLEQDLPYNNEADPAVPAAEPADPADPAADPENPDNSYDGGNRSRHRVKSTKKRSKRRGKSTKKRSKKRVNKSRKRQRRHK